MTNKPFTPIDKPMSVEFFSIFTDGKGQRFIHLHGYTYESDDYWANMEACGILVPLAEFISNYKGDKGGDYINTLYEEAKQYQGDYDEQGIVEVINHYYRDIVFSVDYDNGNGNPDAYLDYGDITPDTPDGQYIKY